MAGDLRREELGLTNGPCWPVHGQRFTDVWHTEGLAAFDPYFFGKPKEKLRFFFEADFSVKAVIDRLPREFEHNRHARVCILEQVRRHVTRRLQTPDLKVFVEEKIPGVFELDGRTFELSYFILPPYQPNRTRPIQFLRRKRSKSEVFAANLKAEPIVSRLAITNIMILFVGFILAVVGVACEAHECQKAKTVGTLMTALAALSLAMVTTYMSFLVASR